MEKSKNGFAICRRCDDCGVRCEPISDNGDRCVLQCGNCGREYSFTAKSASLEDATPSFFNMSFA